MTFKVIDNKTGGEPNLEDIVLNEEWAYSSNLIHCDMEGFAITDSGDLIMLDECGNYEFCPQGRFRAIQEPILDKIREEIVELQKDYQEYRWAYDDAIEIIDKYKAEREE